MTQKTVLLGISGSIAAVKTPELIRLFRDRDFRVRCVMTSGATEFVTPTSLATFSGEKVISEIFHDECYQMQHINWAEQSDIMVMAPATAGIIARCAYGLSDDMVSLTYLSMSKPLLVAPAMHTPMWEHPATQKNVSILKDRGAHFIGPFQGPLADLSQGAGRMAEPRDIVEAAEQLLKQKS